MTKLSEKEFIKVPSKRVPVLIDCDVLVCGAGPAGVAAALAASRSGAKTLLVEKSGCLGGTWTSGLLCWIIDSLGKTGIMDEIHADLKKCGGGTECDGNFSYKPEAMKFILEQKCVESQVEFILHSKVCELIKENDIISHVIIDSPAGMQAVRGKIFIDCSGDGNLGALAQCGYDIGDGSVNKLQPMSMLALIGGIQCDLVSPFLAHYKSSDPYNNLFKELQRGGITPSYSRPTLTHLGNDLFVYNANHQYQRCSFDTKSITEATVNGRLELNEQLAALKSLGGAWKNIELIATSEHIGVREGRRLHGLYTLNIDDLTSGKKFIDAVCRATFCVDIHSVCANNSTGIADYSKCKVMPYDIPLRSLISCDVDNMLMAGRCISGDFLAHGSYRVTGNAVPMGEAAGKTAAMAIKSNISLRDIALNKITKE